MTVEEFLSRLERVKRSGAGWIARCPGHEDRHASLTIGEGDDGRVLINCFAGCTPEEVVAALGLTMADLFADTRTTPRDTRATVQRSPANPHSSADSGVAGQDGEAGVAPLQPDQEGLRACTLEAYAEAKGLPVDFLRSLGLSDAKYADAPAVRMPYVDRDGHEQAVRFRISLHGEDKFRWKQRSKLCLYGLTRLRKARDLGYVVLVEGESCAQTLWLPRHPRARHPRREQLEGRPRCPRARGDRHGLRRDRARQGRADGARLARRPRRSRPAASPTTPTSPGRPRRSSTRGSDPSGHFDRHLGGGADRAARTSARRSRRSSWSRFPDAKDVSELYLQDREAFASRFEEALQKAIPYEEHERIAAQIRARAAWERAGALAKEPRILDVFEGELDGAGVVGERRLCKLIYLAVTGRFLDRFASLAIKGPSASGKSWAIERVLDFFPEEAYYLLTAMSERALAYGTEPLSHRFLVLFEAAGLESDFASYLVRSLLSEGCVRYETVEKGKDGELKARLVEREGPTGLIVSTTSVALHPENETRLLSLSATDTADQTKLVLSRLANDDLTEPDLARWHDLQVWLETAEHRVAIPYARTLADLVPPVAVRLRRDFRAVLSLIRSHALLHQASRERDDAGQGDRDDRGLRGRARAGRRHRLGGRRGDRAGDRARARGGGRRFRGAALDRPARDSARPRQVGDLAALEERPSAAAT